MGYLMKFIALLASAALLASPAFANSFTNGGFEMNAGAGQLGYNTNATGWTTTGYNFLYAPGTADTAAAAHGRYGYNGLWGPGNGSNNGLTAASPSGGFFVAADGDFGTAPISQVITGLKVGRAYTIGFDYAFAQQSGFNGDTIQHWTSSFGGSSLQTADYALPSHGFSGWSHATYTAVATATTQTLSFLAYGNVPVPPFALLDGVTVSGEVPEPATWALLLAGFGAVGIAARRRRTTVAA